MGKLLGFYLLPGVPNTTHITQPTDPNYGRFKDIYRKNLTKLTEHRELRKATIKQGDVPLLVFGGLADNVDIDLQNAFSTAFSFERNQEVWKKIGFEPFTRNCLESNKIRSEIVFLPDGTIDLEANPMTVVLVALENKNKEAVAILNKYGHDGNQFLKKAPRLDPKQSAIAVSLPHTRERQDLLAKCSTAGSRWHVTHGDALNCDDFFISKQRELDRARIVVLTTEKEKHVVYTTAASKATKIINDLMSEKRINIYMGTDTAKNNLLKPQLELLYHLKYGKSPKSGTSKSMLVKAWNDAKHNAPINVPGWTTEDENDLEKVKTDEITMEDTEVGRQAVKMAQSSIAGLAQMSHESVLKHVPINQLEKLKSMLNI